MSTNISPDHISAFEALTSGRFENFACSPVSWMARQLPPSLLSTGPTTRTQRFRSHPCSSA